MTRYITRLRQADCRQIDVTEQASYTVMPPGALKTAPGGVLTPLAPGWVTFTAAYAGETTRATWLVPGNEPRAGAVEKSAAEGCASARETGTLWVLVFAAGVARRLVRRS